MGKYVNVTPNCNSKADEPTNHNYSETGNKANCVNYEESQPTLEPLSTTEQVLFKTIKPLFGCSYEAVNWQSINERIFSTKIMNNPSDYVMKVIDYLAKWKLSQTENLNYLDINFLLDIDAVTSKECLNDLNENCIQKTRKGKCYNG